MDKNIHSYTNTMDEKWIFINYKHRYKWQTLSAPCWNGEIDYSTWASTTSILHIDGNLTRQWQALEEHQCVLKRTKGCRIKHVWMRQQWTIVSFLSNVFLYNASKGLNMYPFNRKWSVELECLQKYGRPRVKLFRTHWGKLQMFLFLCIFPYACRL